jgi:peptide/nickel transport system permease protein
MSESLKIATPQAPNGSAPADDVLETSGDISFLNYRQLTWRRFRKSKLGLISGCVLIVFYAVALFAHFVAPYSSETVDVAYIHTPPQALHFSFANGLHVFGAKYVRDAETGRLKFAPDSTKIFPVRFFAKGVDGHRHLFTSQGPMFLLGTDRMGRDVLSQIIIGSRISLSVGLLGVILSLLLGSFLGTLSGYCGGWTDEAVQRTTELLAAFPGLCLWMAIAAAVPPNWSPIKVYLGITVILSLISWGGLARQVRGKVLAYREQDFVMAARAAGAGHWHIITKHLLPGCYSHIVVISTMAIPGMILGETALSFLGLGIRPPMISWGVLLNEGQRVTVLLQFPWLLFPAVPVLIVVVAFNFLGDALRDAADPYSY